jgi:DNA polymerase I-like protein with 3'-5' exonuclease and polymerase domains
MVSFDCETRDPRLKTHGTGWHRGRDDFHVAGISVATEAGFNRYYPIEHEGGANLDKGKVVSWLQVQLSLPVPKVGAHLLYDLGCLHTINVYPTGPFYDVQVAEPLLVEDRFNYSLDSIAKDRIGKTKRDTPMDELLARTYGRKNPRGNIWRLPGDQPELLDYVLPDSSMPLEVFKIQRPLLEKQDLWDLFILESRLIPMLFAMRRRGVRVDLDRAQQLYDRLTIEQKALQDKLGSAGVWKVAELAPIFDHAGVKYPYTERRIGKLG